MITTSAAERTAQALSAQNLIYWAKRYYDQPLTNDARHVVRVLWREWNSCVDPISPRDLSSLMAWGRRNGETTVKVFNAYVLVTITFEGKEWSFTHANEQTLILVD